jgi:hypothetical protein
MSTAHHVSYVTNALTNVTNIYSLDVTSGKASGGAWGSNGMLIWTSLACYWTQGGDTISNASNKYSLLDVGHYGITGIETFSMGKMYAGWSVPGSSRKTSK